MSVEIRLQDITKIEALVGRCLITFTDSPKRKVSIPLLSVVMVLILFLLKRMTNLASKRKEMKMFWNDNDNDNEMDDGWFMHRNWFEMIASLILLKYSTSTQIDRNLFE